LTAILIYLCSLSLENNSGSKGEQLSLSRIFFWHLVRWSTVSCGHVIDLTHPCDHSTAVSL
jgi:hypothetical protein